MKFLVFLSVLIFPSLLVAKAPMDGIKLKKPLPSNLWIEMSKVTQPGVVGIYIDIDRRNNQLQRDPLFEFLEEFFGQGFEYDSPQDQKKSTPIGTGFIIDRSGLIVTNNHVIEAINNPRLRTKLQVQIYGESKLHDVKVLGQDPRGDLALLILKKPIKNLKPLQLGDSSKLQVGEYVAAFGNPYGHSNSMTVGIVSAKGRAIKELNRFPFIQTDASINPGNSGGPLLNTQGYVIGVNTAIDARAQGIGFAIPADYVKKVIGIMKNGGTIERGYLGVELATLHPRIARSYGIRKRGVIVSSTLQGYPADKAGVRANDIIFEYAGKPFLNTQEFVDMVQDTPVGKTVAIKILRPTPSGFKEKKLKVTITNAPSANKTLSRKTKDEEYLGQVAPYNLGFSVVNSSSGARRSFDIPVDAPSAPIISQVNPRSQADLRGLRPGFLILNVNGTTVYRASDVLKNLRKGANQIVLAGPQGEQEILLKSD